MIIYRNNITKFERVWIEKSIDEAKQFLLSIYPDANFDNIDYIFSHSFNRSRYFRNEIKNELVNCKYIKPTCCIAVRDTNKLYRMKSLNLKYYQVKTGLQVQTICAVIHELTHHIQHNENRSRSELETTKNEVEYLRRYYPIYYNLLTN